MKAVILNGITKAEDVKISECPAPKAISGWVVVKIKAFGLNHSEQILRLSEIRADYIRKPIIPGIECAGEIADPSDTTFKVGQRVVALMGGMGRSFNGSYSEYALLPANHVFAVNTNMDWATLGTIPETFFTAWGSLFKILNLTRGDTLLVRGGTCALGYAAIQLAKAAEAKVAATSHKMEKLPLLKECGADEVMLDDGALAGKIKVKKALELVGPKTLRDTLACVEGGGIVCNAGVLGGEYYLNAFDPIKDIPSGVYLTGFFSNYPAKQDITDIFAFIKEHNIKPRIGAIFNFYDIKNAVAAQDYGSVDGKIVVTL